MNSILKDIQNPKAFQAFVDENMKVSTYKALWKDDKQRAKEKAKLDRAERKHQKKARKAIIQMQDKKTGKYMKKHHKETNKKMKKKHKTSKVPFFRNFFK